MNTDCHNETPLDRVRVILYHKYPTSARTVFLRFGYGGVCAFEPLPRLSEILDEAPARERGTVLIHPAPVVASALKRLNLPSGALEAEGEYQAWVDTPSGAVPVYLVRFTAIDPPALNSPDAPGVLQGARYIAITEARDLVPAEIELLRKAYAVIMEG